MTRDDDTAPPERTERLQRTTDAARLRMDEIDFGPTLDSIPIDEPPARLGRFEILDEIGAGGMGTVFSAHDPMLDRQVAIKVLLASDGDSPERLRREAHAMARLSHPNVAQVYDVDQAGDDLWLAMEYIDGDTLDVWQSAPGRDWREIVAMYVRVGAGLAAAHEAGLLHRDFKPQNVIVGQDGRPRVIDFGLARPASAAMGSQDGLDADDFEGSALAMTLTADGAMVGTPAYMSPEQMMARPVGPATDQFSFCVALYEAIFGGPPFDRSSLRRLLTAVVGGELRDPPGDVAVPHWLHEAISRGLRSEADERWPSMDELLDRLVTGLEQVDLSVGGRIRGQWVLLLVLFGLLEGLYFINAETMPALEVSLIIGIAWTVGGAAFWWRLRRTGGETPFNRTLAAWMTIGPLGMVLGRILCMVTDQSFIFAVAVDMMVFASVSFIIAVLAWPWAAWMGAILYGGAIAAVALPIRTGLFLAGIAAAVSVILLFVFIRRDLQRQQRGRSRALFDELRQSLVRTASGSGERLRSFVGRVSDR